MKVSPFENTLENKQEPLKRDPNVKRENLCKKNLSSLQ